MNFCINFLELEKHFSGICIVGFDLSIITGISIMCLEGKSLEVNHNVPI